MVLIVCQFASYKIVWISIENCDTNLRTLKTLTFILKIMKINFSLIYLRDNLLFS